MARVPPLFNGDYRFHLLKPCICASMMMGNKMLSTFHKYDWFSPPKQSLHNHGQHFLYFLLFHESLGQGFREALPEAFCAFRKEREAANSPVRLVFRCRWGSRYVSKPYKDSESLLESEKGRLIEMMRNPRSDLVDK